MLMVATVTALAACSGSGQAGSPTPTRSPSTTVTAGLPPLKVSHPTVWLCRPGMAQDPCTAPDLDATVVRADGSTSHEAFQPAADAPIDCFYLYPTSSVVPRTVQPLQPDAGITRVTQIQAGRFSSVCRVFAPVYRSITVSGLFRGGVNAAEITQANDDVNSAWHDYLAHDNHGRDVVLIGHSQGSFQLKRLIRDEVDGNDVERSRLVSALILGADVVVPQGEDVGGDFAHISACRQQRQRGCVVGYSSFLGVPPENALFGRVRPTLRGQPVPAGSAILCVNPTALSGGPATMHPYLPTAAVRGGGLARQTAQSPFSAPTGFVTYPDHVTAQCRQQGTAGWLQVTSSRPGDPRPAFTEQLGPRWGLHLLDVNLALDDLIDLVRHQSGQA